MPGRRVAGLSACSAAAVLACTPLQAAAAGLLKTSDRQIVDAGGAPVRLNGFNLGGWFVMEDYMSPMDSAHQLKDTFSVMTALQANFGVPGQRSLMRTYQENWINDGDIRNIAAAGFNVVRIPVWWGQFYDLNDTSPAGWRQDAFEELDRIVQSCRANGVYAVIDMHGAVGGQSPNGDTGQAGRNTYWTDPAAQAATMFMWSSIAAHYAGDPTIAGYDLLNEPAPPAGLPLKATVVQAYDQLYQAVRSADPDHIVFIEDTFGDWRLDMLPEPVGHGWTNVVYEGHEYQFPKAGQSTAQQQGAVTAGADRMVQDYASHSNWMVPFYVGEFNDFATGPDTWRYSVSAFDNAGMSWSMWAYKAVNGAAPNPWGWYDPARWPARPNPVTDSADAIAADWSNWTTAATFAQNSAVGLSR